MANLHPHWQVTEEQAPAASVETVQAPNAQAAATVSRRPAAIVGILLVFGIGYALFQGVGGLLGQVSGEETVLVRITENGLDPAIARVKPGQKIVWHNEDTIPHILYSDVYMVAEDEPWQTSPIFAGANEELTIPSDATGAEYAYGSRTKAAYQGTIIVEGAVSSSSSSEAEDAPLSLSSSSADAGFEPDVPVDTGTSDGGIPQNPYTVDSTPGTPLPAQTVPSVPLMQQTYTKPAVQPESGPTIWILGLASAGLLLLVTRKAFIA